MLGWDRVATGKENLWQQEQHVQSACRLPWRNPEGQSGRAGGWERWGQRGNWRWSGQILCSLAGHFAFYTAERNDRQPKICLDHTPSPCRTLLSLLLAFLLPFPLRWSAVFTLDVLWGPVLRNKSEKHTHNEVGSCCLWKVGRGHSFNKISSWLGLCQSQ